MRLNRTDILPLFVIIGAGVVAAGMSAAPALRLATHLLRHRFPVWSRLGLHLSLRWSDPCGRPPERL